jgi:hypothetical protein
MVTAMHALRDTSSERVETGLVAVAIDTIHYECVAGELSILDTT